MSLNPNIVKSTINMIKNGGPSQQFINLLRNQDFHIAEYSTHIGDPDAFLRKQVMNKNMSKSYVEDVIKNEAISGQIINKDEILSFFNITISEPLGLRLLEQWEHLVMEVNSGIKTIDKLDDSRKKIVREMFTREPGSMFHKMYNHYVSEINRLNGPKPFEGKWSINFCEQVINESNELCTHNGNISIIGLSVLKALSDKNSPHLNNPIYIGFMERILQLILFTIGTNVMNMTPVAKALVKIINTGTDCEYAVLNCKDGLGSYTCGRAVESSHREIPIVPRLIIFNTISDDNDNMDIDYYTCLTNKNSENKLKVSDDNLTYRNKYLKYKQKYLQLKNKL